MPVDSLLVSVFVVAMFAAFAGALFWADRQTRPDRLSAQDSAKRRPF